MCQSKGLMDGLMGKRVVHYFEKSEKAVGNFEI